MCAENRNTSPGHGKTTSSKLHKIYILHDSEIPNWLRMTAENSLKAMRKRQHIYTCDNCICSPESQVWRTRDAQNPVRFSLPVLDYFCRLFLPYLYLFLPGPSFIRIVIQPIRIFSELCQENVVFPCLLFLPSLFAAFSFCKLMGTEF